MSGYIINTHPEWFKRFIENARNKEEIVFWNKSGRIPSKSLKPGVMLFHRITGTRKIKGKSIIKNIEKISLQEAWNKYSTNLGYETLSRIAEVSAQMTGQSALTEQSQILCMALAELETCDLDITIDLPNLGIGFGNYPNLPTIGKTISDEAAEALLERIQKPAMNYFVLRTGGGEYKDEPERRYHFKEGIPGSLQLRNAENNAGFVYLEKGMFYASGSIGKITTYTEDEVNYFYAEVKDYKKFSEPIKLSEVASKLSKPFSQAGIMKITEADFMTIQDEATIHESLIEGLVALIQEKYIPKERIEKRKANEDEAIEILTNDLGKLNRNQIGRIIELLDTDLWQGEIIRQRFGLMLWGRNQRLIVDNEESALNRFFLEIFGKENLEEVDVLTADLKGIGDGFVSSTLYLKDRNKYNIFVERTAKGIEAAFPNERGFQGVFRDRYMRFNSLVNELKNRCGLEPQEMDIVLTELPKWIGRAEEPSSIDQIVSYIETKGFFYPEETIRNYHTSLETKPFVILTGITGIGKTRLTELYANGFHQVDKGNPYYKKISVQPNWNDKKPLLGYFNPFMEKYHSTDFLRFLLRAIEDCENCALNSNGECADTSQCTKRYFVCLDEMNLAHVEYYLADFLSAMETDTKAISLHGKKVEAEDERLIPASLRIPPNFFITGTVNIDETTKEFSPKVLDRANTVDLDVVDLEKWREIQLRIGRRIHEEAFKVIKEVHDILRKYNMHFGYRVCNEILNYIEKSGMDLSRALDLQIKQKILPKLGGDDNARLRGSLEEFNKYLAGTAYTSSTRKVANMLAKLSSYGFTSFYD